MITNQDRTVAWVEYRCYFGQNHFATEQTMGDTIAKCDRNPGSVAYAAVHRVLENGDVVSDSPTQVYRS